MKPRRVSIGFVDGYFRGGSSSPNFIGRRHWVRRPRRWRRVGVKVDMHSKVFTSRCVTSIAAIATLRTIKSIRSSRPRDAFIFIEETGFKILGVPSPPRIIIAFLSVNNRDTRFVINGRVSILGIINYLRFGNSDQ